MQELKSIIATNITQLRRESGMTQVDIAEKLNYSDKAVSKWERGESVPDISVLKEIADIFGVTVDYLLKTDHRIEDEKRARIGKRKFRNRAIVATMAVVLVWLVAVLVFFILDSATSLNRLWLVFIYAVPASFVVWLVFNSIWFNRRWNFLIISLLMWCSLASLFITLIGFDLGKIFFVGIPAQVIVLLWSGIRTRSRKK